MKKKLNHVILTITIFSSFFGNAQQTLNRGGSVTPVSSITTIPSNVVSQLQVEGALLTQNSNIGNFATGTNATGSFSSTARWNSMGNFSILGSQTLNGFRTQTDGKGLAWGHSIPSGGSVSNSFIEIIGSNTGAAAVTPTVDDPQNLGSSSGNLDFRYAESPTGSNSARRTAFTIQPVINPPAGPQFDAFNYARKNCLIGQLQEGKYGGFGSVDIWSGTGQVTASTLNSFGTRQQYKGFTFNSGIVDDGLNRPFANIDFGYNATIVSSPPNNISLKFRTFNDPNNTASISNIMQLSNRLKNIVVSRGEIDNINALLPTNATFNFGIFDGPSAVPTNLTFNFISRAGMYATSDGFDDNNTQISAYAAVAGDISSCSSPVKVGILGVANTPPKPDAGTNANIWAGYFIGRLGYTGSLISVSDRKYKKSINTETTIMDKVMQLAPKNYYFDVEKNKNMALSNTLQHGFISEEVEKIFPELVEEAYGPSTSTDAKTNGKPESYKGLNYIGFIPVLTKAIQELNEKITVLEKQLADAKSATYVATKTVTPQEQQLLANKTYMLAQNVPNPFSQSTVIRYSLPNNTDKAVLVIFNLNGTLIQQFALSAAKGSSQVTVNAGTLAAGKYIYSLIVNGEEVITKTMVVL